MVVPLRDALTPRTCPAIVGVVSLEPVGNTIE
jgi:hypothetical protein